jgi:hypothetical protein
MKKIFLFMAAALSTVFSFASGDHPLTVSAGQFKNIQLGSDMNVVIVSAKQLQNEITTGSVAVYEKLNIAVVGNQLRLELRQKLDKNEKIYIVVEEVQSLTVGDNTTVVSENALPGKKIVLSVGQGAVARLKTNATVKAFGADGLPLDVFTNTVTVEKEAKPL